jgi:altronate hydrolase
MNPKVLQLNPRDNVLVALQNLQQGETVTFGSQAYRLGSNVPAKHKFAIRDLAAGDPVTMYGVLVGKAVEAIQEGQVLSTRNVRHDSAAFQEKSVDYRWTPPDVARWAGKTYQGYRRSDGQFGTRNYWLVVPLVFC